MAFDFTSRRSPVLARHAMVAASQPLAAMAGIEILRQGGCAADAAVGTAAALNVTEPTSTGIGGDCFALYYDAATRKVSALNGSGRAPAALSLERLAAEGLNSLPPFHAHTVTVPGACAGWCDLIERHGTMPLQTILAPAIRLAEEGFPVAPSAAFYWQRGVERQLKTAPGGRALTIDGRAPRAGEIFRNPGLARTFRAVADGGKEAYYRGEIAASIARRVQEAGGVMTVEDLAGHTSTWDPPISTVYRGLRVWECPPNGQGLAALIALNLLEGFDLSHQDPLGAERWHTLIEAMRVAFADTSWYVADPAFSRVPVNGLLDKTYAAERRRRIDPTRATLDTTHGAPVASSDTVYFCVVDAKGNACAFINANWAETQILAWSHRGLAPPFHPRHTRCDIAPPRRSPSPAVVPRCAAYSQNPDCPSPFAHPPQIVLSFRLNHSPTGARQFQIQVLSLLGKFNEPAVDLFFIAL